MKRLYVTAAITGAGMQILLAGLMASIGAVSQGGEALAELGAQPWWVHAVVITILMVWACLEELFFRGLLWRYLPAPEVTTSLLFATAHIMVSPVDAYFLLPFGFLLGFWRRAGLWASIACHLAFNSVGIALSFI